MQANRRAASRTRRSAAGAHVCTSGRRPPVRSRDRTGGETRQGADVCRCYCVRRTRGVVPSWMRSTTAVHRSLSSRDLQLVSCVAPAYRSSSAFGRRRLPDLTARQAAPLPYPGGKTQVRTGRHLAKRRVEGTSRIPSRLTGHPGAGCPARGRSDRPRRCRVAGPHTGGPCCQPDPTP